MSIVIVISSIAAALVAGGLALVSLGIVRAGRTLDATTWTALHRALDRTIGPYFQLVLPIAIVTSTAVAVAPSLGVGVPVTAAVRLAYAVAAALFVAIFVVSVRGNVPINREVAAWTAPPADWAMRRARWNALQAIRASAAMAAFVGMVGAAWLA